MYTAVYGAGQVATCRQKASACMDLLGRYTDEEVVGRLSLVATLHSRLGSCDMLDRRYEAAIDQHGRDLNIGEEMYVNVTLTFNFQR